MCRGEMKLFCGASDRMAFVFMPGQEWIVSVCGADSDVIEAHGGVYV